jgi:hypothetical protein
MYDINVEHWGWNKRSDEKTSEYIQRIWEDDYLSTVSNNAFDDMSFEKSMRMNDLCKPQDSTYYFSYTTGIKEKVGNDRIQVETNPEIKNFTDDVIGFDLHNSNNIKWQDIARKEEKTTLFDKAITCAKQISDPFFTYFRYWIHNHKYEVPKIFENQKDNKNWDALDWDHKRWQEDNDTLVSRVSQEFPRISHSYTKLSSEDKPWGVKDPAQFNWEDSTKVTRFEKGRWFYTALEHTNHLDIAGWPRLRSLEFFRVLLGVENRFEFSKQLFERLYSLEFK